MAYQNAIEMNAAPGEGMDVHGAGASVNSDNILEKFSHYRHARRELLAALDLRSNRDPLAEFSEWLVAQLTRGRLAGNRVQPGYDVVGPAGERIQVKYLANPTGKWINEHPIKVDDQMDAYAIVFFVDLVPTSVAIFSSQRLAEVARALGKRHPNQDTTLQLTKRNLEAIFADADTFKALGLRLHAETGSGWGTVIREALAAK